MGKILFDLIPSAIRGFTRYFFCFAAILPLFISVNHSQSAADSPQSSAAAPAVTTDSASRVTHNSATLRGTVNANDYQQPHGFNTESSMDHPKIPFQHKR